MNFHSRERRTYSQMTKSFFCTFIWPASPLVLHSPIPPPSPSLASSCIVVSREGSEERSFLSPADWLVCVVVDNVDEKEEEEEEEEEKKVRVSAGGGAWNLDGVEQELSALYTERFHDLVHQKILPGLFLELDEMSKKKCQQLSTGLGRMDGRKKKEEEDLMRWSKVTRNLVRMLSPRTRKTWVGNFIESLILTRVGREHVDQVSVVLLLVTHCVRIVLNDDVRTTPVTTALEL